MPHKKVLNKDGTELPSVTQVIGILGKPELYAWYAKNGFAKCEAIKREAGEWGSELHESISQYLKGEEVSVSSRSYPMLMAFSKWKEDSGFKPVVVEPDEPYVSLYGYQGTFDAIGELDGEVIVADWKTSSRIYPENGLQLAAYAQLYEEANPGVKVRNGLIVRIDKKTAKIQTKGFYNLPMYFNVFKSLLPVYDFVRKEGVWKDGN